MKRLIGVALLLLAGACSGGQERHTVEMRGFAFVPDTLEVRAGDTVEFVNGDVVPHTATAQAWRSGNVAAGALWSVVMADTGTVDYVCDLHPSMRGSIAVR